MEDKRILYVSSEVVPYLAENEVSLQSYEMPKMINHYLYPLDNQYILLLFSIPCFLLLLPLSYFSYEYIEKPFLKYRKKYLIELEKNVNH